MFECTAGSVSAANPSSEQAAGGTDRRGRQKITWQAPTASQREDSAQVSHSSTTSVTACFVNQCLYSAILCAAAAVRMLLLLENQHRLLPCQPFDFRLCVCCLHCASASSSNHNAGSHNGNSNVGAGDRGQRAGLCTYLLPKGRPAMQLGSANFAEWLAITSHNTTELADFSCIAALHCSSRSVNDKSALCH